MKYLLFLSIYIMLSCSQRQDEITQVDGTDFRSEEIEKKTVTTSPDTNEDFFKNLSNNKNLLNEGVTEEIDTRKPLFVYYVVDSPLDEPYMDFAVQYEIDALKRVCAKGGDHANWLIVRNKDVRNSSQIEFCYKGQYKKKEFIPSIDYRRDGSDHYGAKNCSDFPNIQENQRFTNILFCTEDYMFPHQDTTKFGLYNKIATELGQTTLKPENLPPGKLIFEEYRHNYPLAHPQTMQDVLWRISEEAVLPFSDDEFIKVLHIKSHGHFDYAIAALYDYQTKEKIKWQKKALKMEDGGADPQELSARGLNKPVEGFLERHLQYEKEFFDLLGKLNLELKDDINQSPASNTQSTNDTTNDNSASVSVSSFGLDDTDSTSSVSDQTLGVTCGLGGGFNDSLSSVSFSTTSDLNSKMNGADMFIGNSMGITPLQLKQILSRKKLISDKSNFISTQSDEVKTNRVTAFAFVEACDSASNPERWNSIVGDFRGYIPSVYSAVGSLNFRNIDMEPIFDTLSKVDDSRLHTTMMQHFLIKHTSDIKNDVYDNMKEYIKKYDEILEKVNDYEYQLKHDTDQSLPKYVDKVDFDFYKILSIKSGGQPLGACEFISEELCLFAICNENGIERLCITDEVYKRR